MRSVLRKLQCNNYITLVAASSIIRPGVGSSGMMQQYIWRYHNRDKFAYLHPIMKDLLEETFGVMFYQEDVIVSCCLTATKNQIITIATCQIYYQLPAQAADCHVAQYVYPIYQVFD